MLFTELPIAFPWYPKIEQQNRYNENVEPVCDYKLVTPRDAMLPFQFVKPVAGIMPNLWEIFEINTNNQVANITTSVPFLNVRKIEGKEYFYYDGRTLKAAFGADLSLAPGYYYSRMAFPNGEMFFSEMFYVPAVDDGAFNIADDDNIPFIRLEWWNDGDLRPIFYRHIEPGQTKPVFRNVAYIDTFITASEPEITEDGTRDGEDELIPTFQKVVVPYRITIVVPDFFKKALMVMQIHDHMVLATKFGVRSGEIRKVVISSALEAAGGLSVVDILFQQDVATVKKGCADNMNADCSGGFLPGLNPVTTAGSNYVLNGTSPAGSTIRFFRLNSPMDVPTEDKHVGGDYTNVQFTAGVSIPTADFFGSAYVVARSFSFGCDYGFTNVAHL